MKYGYLTLLFACALVARENPFLPSDIGSSDINTTNIITSVAEFEQVSTTLPSDARELDALVLRYKSIDGSIKEKEISIKEAIDWHDTFVLSKKVAPKTAANEILDVSVTSSEPGGKSTQAPAPDMSALEMNSSVVSTISAGVALPPLGSVELEKRLKIDVYSNKISLNTADMLLKSYDDGTRIVLDFAKSGADFLTKSENVSAGVIKKVTLGSHGKFYRVVLQLDKKYKYSIRQNSAGYTIWLGK